MEEGGQQTHSWCEGEGKGQGQASLLGQGALETENEQKNKQNKQMNLHADSRGVDRGAKGETETRGSVRQAWHSKKSISKANNEN